MGKWVQAIAVMVLTFSLGMHWVLLQTVAWSGMVVTYAQEDCLRTALVKTFDGQHPCTLCRVVEDGRSAEKKPSTTLKLAKLEVCFLPTIVIQVPEVSSARSIPMDRPEMSARSEAPFLRPPRFV